MGARRGRRVPAATPDALHAAPAAQGHARLSGGRIGDLRGVHGVHAGPEPRPDVARVVSLSHADADLHRQLPGDIPAPRPFSDVEPGGRGGVLRRVARARLRAPALAARRCVAAGPHADGVGGTGRNHPCVAASRPHHRCTSEHGRHVAASTSCVFRRRDGVGRSGGRGSTLARQRDVAVGGGAVSDRRDTARRGDHRTRSRLGAGHEIPALRGHCDARGGPAGPWVVRPVCADAGQ